MANEAQIEAKKIEIRRLLEEIAFLSKSDLPTHEYFRRFLELTTRALAAPGGVIWLKSDQGYQRLCAIKFPDTEFDGNDAQRQSILKVLADVTENRRPVVLGAFDANAAADENAVVLNRTSFPFFFAPILLHNQVVAILHVWLAPETDPKTYRDFITFLQTVTGQAEIYLRARRLESLAAESQKLSQLVTLLGEMEGQLDSDKLALTVVNYGREVIGSDRVCVTVRRREKVKVLAVSGVEVVDKKSALVKSIVILAKRALAADEPQWLSKGDEHAQEKEIAEYFTRGTMRAAYIIPMKNRDDETVGALVVETTKPDGIGESVRKLAQAVARHAGTALGAAEDEASVPFLSALRRLKYAKEWAVGPKRRRIQLAIGIPVAVIFFVAMIPWPFQLAGDCQLMPVRRGVAVSEVDGRIATVFAKEGQPVKARTILAELDDTELQRQLAVAMQEQAKSQAEADRYRVSRDPAAQAARRVAELAAKKTGEDVKHLQYQIDQTKIRSPIDGVVMTKDLQTRVGEVMKNGEVFAEIGEPSLWEVQIQTKESDVYPLEKRLRQNRPVPVTLLMRGLTDQKFHAQVTKTTDISQLSYPPPGGTTNVFYVTAELNLSESGLPKSEVALLRPGFTGRAKMDAGWHVLGYILTRKFWDYLRVNWFL